MSNTITVRLPEDLAGWLEAASKKAGVPRGRIIREQLELARIRLSELNSSLPVITTDLRDFRVYRRGRRDVIRLLHPPEA